MMITLALFGCNNHRLSESVYRESLLRTTNNWRAPPACCTSSPLFCCGSSAAHSQYHACSSLHDRTAVQTSTGQYRAEARQGRTKLGRQHIKTSPAARRTALDAPRARRTSVHATMHQYNEFGYQGNGRFSVHSWMCCNLATMQEVIHNRQDLLEGV